MKIELKPLLELIETKTSWGKEVLKQEILKLLAEQKD